MKAKLSEIELATMAPMFHKFYEANAKNFVWLEPHDPWQAGDEYGREPTFIIGTQATNMQPETKVPRDLATQLPRRPRKAA